MSAKVNGLGHIGFYVKDLELMKEFYEFEKIKIQVLKIINELA